jgi:hypothetical protein
LGVRILDGIYDGTEPSAVLIDSVSGEAFGPRFSGYDDAEEFLTWFGTAAREDAAVELGLCHTHGLAADDDPRAWSANGLRELHRAWERSRAKVAA